MRRLLTLIVVSAACFGAPASALECADVFDLIGRPLLESDVHVEAPLLEDNAPFECSAVEMAQLVFDFAAADNAVDVTDARQLVGTWVSDDVLATYAGLFIPVYEVLEIARGDNERTVTISQKLIRATDPADWLADAGGTDVVAAGRIATYGEHLAELTEAGTLQARRVRYHDFPVETDRTTGLAMKLGMMAFLSVAPIRVRTDGRSLVLTLTDRISPQGERIMTFRKRRADLPEMALLLALSGYVSMTKFHCLLEAMDAPTPAYLEALDTLPEAELLAALKEAQRLSSARESAAARMREPMTDVEREALVRQMRADTERLIDVRASAPLTVLQREVESGAPFGCPDLY